MRYTFLLLLLLVWERGYANIDSTSFGSIEAAVVAASNRFNPESIKRDVEYLGAILRHHLQPDTYIYTWQAGQVGVDKVRARIPIAAGYEIVAFWHTHGGEHHTRRFFSEDDIELASSWNLPFYLADHTGRLKVFEKGQRTLFGFANRSVGASPFSKLAKGRVVLDESGTAFQIETRERP